MLRTGPSSNRESIRTRPRQRRPLLPRGGCCCCYHPDPPRVPPPAAPATLNARPRQQHLHALSQQEHALPREGVQIGAKHVIRHAPDAVARLEGGQA